MISSKNMENILFIKYLNFKRKDVHLSKCPKEPILKMLILEFK